MKHITDEVFQLERAQGANGYLVRTPTGVVLIDPGIPFTARAVVRELSEEGLLKDVTDILLTHYDMDHAGAVDRLVGETGAEVWIGAEDAAILRGEARPGGGLTRTLMAAFGRSRVPENTHLLQGETQIRSLTAMPSPGHTPGHYSFRWRSCVFSGDAFTVDKHGEFNQFPGFLTTDPAAAIRSTLTIRNSGAEWICPGHGQAVELAVDAIPPGPQHTEE